MQRRTHRGFCSTLSTWRLVGLLVPVAVLAACGESRSPSSPSSSQGSSPVSPVSSGDEAVRRAMSWVTAGMPYCGALPGELDFLCSMTCDREAARQTVWDTYRSDCSGLVSFSWGLPAPGLVTGAFFPKRCRRECAEQGVEISVAELRPGDALNRWPLDPATSSVGHIRLFARWVDSGHRTAEILEEHTCGGSARRFRARFELDPAGRPIVVELGSNGGTSRDAVPFHPIRRSFPNPPCGSPSPGHFTDGSTGVMSDALWLAFVAARTSEDASPASIGCPSEDVRDVHSIAVQEYDQLLDSERFPDSDGRTALVYDDGARPPSCCGAVSWSRPAAYLLRGSVWHAWKCMRADDGRQFAGALFLGAPTMDQAPGAMAWRRASWCYDPGEHGYVDVSAAPGRQVVSFQCFQRGYVWTGVDRPGEPMRTHVHVAPLIDGAVPDFSRCLSPAVAGHIATEPLAFDLSSGTLFREGADHGAVYLARGNQKHAIPDETCLRVLSGRAPADVAAPVASVAGMNEAGIACRGGTFYRKRGTATAFGLVAGRLHPICGEWSADAFRRYSGTSFGNEIVVDEARWSSFTAAYPVARGEGIFPPGVAPPRCGDAGFECGVIPDPDGGLCRPTLDCGPCLPQWVVDHAAQRDLTMPRDVAVP